MLRLKRVGDSLNYIVFQNDQTFEGKKRNGEPKTCNLIAGGSVHLARPLAGDAEEIEIHLVTKQKEVASAKTTATSKK